MTLKNKLSIITGIFLVVCIMLGVLYVSCLSAGVSFLPCLLACIIGIIGAIILATGIWFIIRAFL